MGGFELTRTIGETSATYKFTAKAVLKADQKVTVNHLYSSGIVSICKAFEHTALWQSAILTSIQQCIYILKHKQ